MVFNSIRNNDTVYVSIRGDVNRRNEQDLLRKMRLLLKDNFNEVIFDLSHVPHITGPTIGKFLMFYKNAEATGRSMRIKGVHESIYRNFQTLRLDRLFPVEK